MEAGIVALGLGALGFHFGNKNNEPILKGRSTYSNDDELKI